MSGNSFPTGTQTVTFLWLVQGLGVSCPPTPTHPRPHFSFLTGTLIQKATALEATEECWPGLPSGVFQTPHCSLRPKYLPLEWVRVSPFFFFFFWQMRTMPTNILWAQIRHVKAIRALATERLPCEDGGHTERIRPQGHPPTARQLPSTMSGS